VGDEAWISLPAATRAACLLRRVQRLRAGVVSSLAALSILGLGLTAARVPLGLDLNLLLVVPVAIATAAAGFDRGVSLGLFATAVWTATDLLDGVTGGTVVAGNAALRTLGLLFVIVMVDTTMRQLRLASLLSWTDELTGLPNRRAFLDRAELELARMRRTGTPTTVVYLDVDGFKGVNDHHGHEVGDDVLRRIGHALRSRVRATDVAARLGGDEFVLLLTDTDAAAAEPLLRQLQRGVAADASPDDTPITASIGAVTFLSPPASVNALLRAPDGLMYEAKRDGRSALQHAVHDGSVSARGRAPGDGSPVPSHAAEPDV
jgi:diguanylate cyclase (GGDEF)-like protein